MSLQIPGFTLKLSSTQLPPFGQNPWASLSLHNKLHPLPFTPIPALEGDQWSYNWAKGPSPGSLGPTSESLSAGLGAFISQSFSTGEGNWPGAAHRGKETIFLGCYSAA